MGNAYSACGRTTAAGSVSAACGTAWPACIRASSDIVTGWPTTITVPPMPAGCVQSSCSGAGCGGTTKTRSCFNAVFASLALLAAKPQSSTSRTPKIVATRASLPNK
eukprot:CAMPEP_0175450068 /NCGR_PEP_ID=MMETSP0095-20121207/62177_1 /TAXON_ID=311494 /ORGANISM="Alexandrium monilatum, Strain CCMP3105" /LENGTH=106 /DNA_ID=CAMNT_0016750525 /DNA_START=525 /DNA_END=845 /DNA_ORIENTATION=+